MSENQDLNKNSYGPSGYGSPSYGNYGYGGQGGYYYGYNYGANYGATSSYAPTRSIKDYLLILRERIWHLIVVLFIIFTGTALYTLNKTPFYRAQSRLQLLRDDRKIIGDDIEPNAIMNAEDFNTQLEILRSQNIIQAVAQRIKDDEKDKFIEPFSSSLIKEKSVEELLNTYRGISPERLTLIVNISFDHPYRDIAIKVADYFADEYINYGMRRNIDTSMMAVEDLRVRVEQQAEKVREIRKKMSNYREEIDRVSIDDSENFEIVELQSLNEMLVGAKASLDQASTIYDQIKVSLESGKPLQEIPTISSSSRVQELLTQLSQRRIEFQALSKRYRSKHPYMITATESLEQTEKELSLAINERIQEISAEFEFASENYDRISKRLELKKQEIMELNRLAVPYKSLQSELEVNENVYQIMESQLREQTARIQLQGPSARVLDRASCSLDPFSPNIPLYLAFGLFGGLAAGFGVVFIVAFLDDRIKSAYDIEVSVGLPLIGVVPRINRMNSSEKAQAVASNRERRVTEAFRAIHSALRINEASKTAKVILVTSTSPSEGKSFIVTNLALTYAIHGEHTLVLDCDLRLPNIAKSMSIDDSTKGVVHYFKHEVSLEDAILQDVYPNLDVMPAGKKATNPTQILTSPAFELLINELADKYDRIIIDSPPIAAVSDVLTLLPFSDGVIYAMKFNAVKKRSVKSNLRRILESNTPVFGAILNQISTAVASYYYSNYYDKSYNEYFSKSQEEEESEELVAADSKEIK